MSCQNPDDEGHFNDESLSNDDLMDVDNSGNHKISTPLTKEDINDLLIKMFVACNIPFRAVDNIHFKNFLNGIQRSECLYEPPCRQTLSSSTLFTLHKKIIEERRKLLKNTISVVLVDGWKNKSNNKKFLVFSLKNENTNHTYLTCFDYSLESEDGDSLAKTINKAVRYAKKEYKTNVIGIVTDNDSKIVCGARLANSADKTHLWQSTCNSHSGNLFLKSLVDKNFAESVTSVVNAYRDTKVQRLLKNQGGTQVQNFPDTRFCFFKDTCESILNNLDIMKRISMVEDIRINEKVVEIVNSKEFEITLKKTIDLLEPVCVLINTCQSPKCTVADAVELWLDLRASKKFDENLINDRINDKKAIRPIGYAANYLHPKYVGKSLNEEEEKQAFDFFQDNFDYESLLELDRFLNDREPVVEKLRKQCNDPIEFWNMCEVFYPNLHKVALKLSLMPASTAALESLFSNWAFIHNAHRNRLSNSKSSALVDIYYSLRHFKFDTANVNSNEDGSDEDTSNEDESDEYND